MKEYYEFLEREDLIDKSTRKLKHVKEVVEDPKTHDFPKIRDCGPDEAQNWYEPDPLDCSGYFRCTGTYYRYSKCAPGLYFDLKTNTCTWPEDCDCGDRQIFVLPNYEGPQPYQYHNFFDFPESKLDKDNIRERWLTFDKIETDYADTEENSSLAYEYSM